MRADERLPVEVYRRAHLEYPFAVGRLGLYGVAFFGHGRPRDLRHKETPDSVWRGLVRKHLRQYVQEAKRRRDGATGGAAGPGLGGEARERGKRP